MPGRLAVQPLSLESVPIDQTDLIYKVVDSVKPVTTVGFTLTERVDRTCAVLRIVLASPVAGRQHLPAIPLVDVDTLVGRLVKKSLHRPLGMLTRRGENVLTTDSVRRVRHHQTGLEDAPLQLVNLVDPALVRVRSSKPLFRSSDHL